MNHKIVYKYLSNLSLFVYYKQNFEVYIFIYLFILIFFHQKWKVPERNENHFKTYQTEINQKNIFRQKIFSEKITVSVFFFFLFCFVYLFIYFVLFCLFVFCFFFCVCAFCNCCCFVELFREKVFINTRPRKSRTTSTNVHSAAMWGYRLLSWRPA